MIFNINARTGHGDLDCAKLSALSNYSQIRKSFERLLFYS
jgi:hypothetical protein